MFFAGSFTGLFSRPDTSLELPRGRLTPSHPVASTNSSNQSPESPLEAPGWGKKKKKSPSNIMSEFLYGLLLYTRDTHTHKHTHLHTPVCQRSPLGLPQTCADITIKPRTPRRCTVIHHTHPKHTRKHTNAGSERRGRGVLLCMLRGEACISRWQLHKASWLGGVEINFQPRLGSSPHYSAPLEWIFLGDKRTICCPFPLFLLISWLSCTFPCWSPLVSAQSCHQRCR